MTGKIWKNGGIKIGLWRIIVAILLVVVIPVVAWALLQIVDFPKVYVEKEVVKDLSIKIDTQYGKLTDKIDTQYNKQMDSISDINRYLRELSTRRNP